MKILIVDDERVIREGIAGIVRQMDLFSDVDTAGNGVEALELCRKNSYSILLLDILMPKMNGIEFLEELEKLEQGYMRETEIPLQPIRVVISGHDEFEYARKCMQWGVEEFILKPIEPGEIQELVRKLHGKARVVAENKARQMRLKEQVKAGIPVLREKYFWDVIDQNLTAREIIEKGKFIEIDIAAQAYIVAVAAAAEGPAGTEMMRKLGVMAFESTLENTPMPGVRMLNFEIGLSRAATIFCFGDGPVEEGEVESYLSQTVEQLYEEEGFSLNIGIGRAVEDIESIRRSYQQASQALQYAFLLSEHGVQTIRDGETNHLQGLSLEDMATLSNAIKLGRRGEAENYLSRAFSELERVSAESVVPYSKVLLTGIIYTCLSILQQRNIRLEGDRYVSYYSVILDDNALHSVSQLKEVTGGLVFDTMDIIEDQQAAQKSIFTQRAKEMVEEYYNQNLSTAWVAEELALSRNYFGQLFKKEVGMSFNEYLSKKRIQVAMQLLGNPTLKIYEISQSVGIEDSYYFSNLFKKLVGASPSEYRDMQQ